MSHAHAGHRRLRRRGRFGRARRGDVRAGILALLAEEPMHGYQIIQELESRSDGRWRPSPGSVYPTLQLLEDEGLVGQEEADGRRVYTLTEEGRSQAADLLERAGKAPWELSIEGDDTVLRLQRAAFQVEAAAAQALDAGSREQVEQAIEVLADARRRIYAILAEEDAPAR
ncbi:MAG TPA: PadR family transcriptional regulator [Gaiellaceae bacterium]|nr:PadR family transcriptional regulator [Gaiellaceae bacterium]